MVPEIHELIPLHIKWTTIHFPEQNKTYAQVFGDDVRDQFDAAALSNIESFDQWQRLCGWLNLAQQSFALGWNKLMWHNEDQYISIFGGFN